MKHNKFTKLLAIILVIVFSCNMLTACNIEQYFVFGGSSQNLEGNEEVKINPNIETFEGTKNAIFFALYNYYGYEGQHFTNKWLGMNDALKAHGITVTGFE